MGIRQVKEYFERNGYDFAIYELEESTATVKLAAKAHGVVPAMIAKSLVFGLKDGSSIMIITTGNTKIENKKYKQYFGQKAKMLKADEVLEITGHPIGGVCPFGLKTPMNIYLDQSLLEFEYVYPAAGSTNSSIKISPQQLQKITQGTWVDLCK